MEDSPQHMPLAMLRERCQQEMRKVRGEETANSQYCLEIFHRAIKKRDELAWEILIVTYRQQMLVWFYRHPGRDRALDLDSAENYIAYAFTRFWQSTTHNQTVDFPTLGSALGYLKASVDGAVKDTLRIHKRSTLHLPEPGAEYSFEEPVAEEEDDGRELWDAISFHLHTDRERLVAYLIIHCNFKPREVFRRYPHLFKDVNEIYRIYRNIDDRLKRHKGQLRWRLSDEENLDEKD